MPQRDVIETDLTGFDLLAHPMLNKGTAFSEEERDAFQLHGLLPSHVGTLDQQVERRLRALRVQETALERYAFCRDLQDINETLFFALLVRHAEELMPIVYTPTVGEGCQRFSEIWRRPRGVFLSYPNRHRIAEILASPRYDRVRVICVSDGERILGLGDQGAGGMGIPIGKLALYTALGGIHPEEVLPVLLDGGTDNQARLDDPLYIGWRNKRVRGEEYDAFVHAFVDAAAHRWPKVLLQFEDFAGHNAARLLDRYRDWLCCFNDDIQGTAAVAAGTLLAAIAETGIPLTEQRVAILGAGAAGCGIASLLCRAMVDAGLSEAEARRRFYAIDRHGLLVEGMEATPSQAPFVQPGPGGSLADVVARAHPTTLIGVSGQAGAFTEPIIRELARHVQRPVIFPLSNPTACCEATPADLLAWTDGRAIVATGSPFAPVDGKPISQCNNAYIFPGLGLGVLAVGARRVTDGMFMAAAQALAALRPADRLLPPITKLREVSVEIAMAVAKEAEREGLAEPHSDDDRRARVLAQMWEPRYRPFRRIG